jgi:tRNA (guanosine-2'-O-)-methyltransferase
MASDRRIAKVRSVYEHRQPDLTVVLENIHDSHNVSAILRTCDAVGINRVALLYTIEEFPKIGKQSSASAWKWVDRDCYTSVAECYASLRATGFKIFATHLDSMSTDLYACDFVQPTAIVFGNENRGISAEALAQADGNIRIPQVGMLQSLNVSVSCAVTLYEAMRQRLAAGSYDAPKLEAEEIAARVKAGTAARWERRMKGLEE